MEPYQRLCSMLFQAVSKAGHFKDLKIFYFHNRPGNLVYKEPCADPVQRCGDRVDFEKSLPDYRVIFIGDAEMSVNDLLGRRGAGGDLKSGIGLAAGIQEPLLPYHLAASTNAAKWTQLLDPII